MENISENLMRNNDVIASRISSILKSNEFELNISFLKEIHNYLFKDIIPAAGEFRTYNLNKKESILNGESIIYADYSSILDYLNYDIDMENTKHYHKYNNELFSKNIAKFTSSIWQTHPFCEGNTRTVSIYIEKYLKSLNHPVDNSIFKENNSYYRNALVKSCYYNEELRIHNDLLPLIAFYNKILFDNSIELDNNCLIIKELFNKENKDKIRKLTKKNNYF